MPSCSNDSAISSRSWGRPGVSEYFAHAPSAIFCCTNSFIGSGVSKLGIPWASEITPGMRLAASSISLIGDSLRCAVRADCQCPFILLTRFVTPFLGLVHSTRADLHPEFSDLPLGAGGCLYLAWPSPRATAGSCPYGTQELEALQCDSELRYTPGKPFSSKPAS